MSQRLERVVQRRARAPSAGSRLSRPARSSSPRMAMMPPARCTSSSARRRPTAPPCRAPARGATAGRCPAMVNGTCAFVGGGQQMQHGVGRAAHRDVERHGVLERLEARDVARQHGLVVLLVVAPREIDDQVAGLDEQPLAVGMRRQHRAVARQRQAQRLGQAVHRVGREHARARAAGRAGRALDHLDLGVADLVVGGGDHGVDQVDRAASCP